MIISTSNLCKVNNGRISKGSVLIFESCTTNLNSISAFFKENVEPKVKSRRLVIPGKVAVLKGDLEAKLPGWEIIVGPREAVQLVKFLKDMQADGQI